MTNHSQPTFDPVALAVAKTAIEAIFSYPSVDDLLTVSRNCTDAISTVSAELSEKLTPEELGVIIYSLLSVKDIAISKAVALAFEEERA